GEERRVPFGLEDVERALRPDADERAEELPEEDVQPARVDRTNLAQVEPDSRLHVRSAPILTRRAAYPGCPERRDVTRPGPVMRAGRRGGPAVERRRSATSDPRGRRTLRDRAPGGRRWSRARG